MDLYRFLFPDEFTRNVFAGLFSALGHALATWWWIILPPILFYVFLEIWITHWRKEFLAGVKWDFFELKVPRDILTTPKVMEQVFAGLQVICSTPDTWQEELRDHKIPFKAGELPLWVSFEIVGTHEGISFFVRSPAKFSKLIEAQFLSQYPQMQIVPAKDYTERFQALPNAYTDMWSTEYKQGQDPIFPIKTYEFFEAKVEEQRLDSMAPFLELLSHLNEGEEIWLQIITRGLTGPQSKAWAKQAQASVDKLIGKKVKEEPKGVNPIVEFLESVLDTIKEYLASLGGGFFAEAKKEEKKEEKVPESLVQFMSPGQKDRVEQAEHKIAKPVFETMIRVIYQAPKSVYDLKPRMASINSYFRTFNTANLNEFKGKKKDYNFFAQMLFGPNLKRRDSATLFRLYKERIVEPAPQFHARGEFKPMSTEDIAKRTLLNTEELATLYHFPISQVGASKLYRVQTTTQPPPPDLPVIE